MADELTFEGSVSLTDALNELAAKLAADYNVHPDTRIAAANLAKCLAVMDSIDCLIAVQV